MRAGDAASAEMESIVGDTKVGLRADIVGSLLRPGSIHEARRRGQKGVINDADLRAVDDAAIQGVIAPDRPGRRHRWRIPSRELGDRIRSSSERHCDYGRRNRDLSPRSGQSLSKGSRERADRSPSERSLWRDRLLQPKTAFWHFPPVHWVDLEGRLR
jgi:hypothetical protein